MGIIIGIMGQARSGKDTTAEYLAKHHKVVRIGLADPMKRFCKEVFDFSDAQLWGDDRDKADTRYFRGNIDPSTLSGNYLSPRYALQTLGTEWGRDCYHSVWIEYGLRIADELINGGYAEYTAKDGLIKKEKDVGICPGVVFSDIRFINEYQAIKDHEGLKVRIKRPGFEGKVGVEGHASENEQQALSDGMFDVILDNSGDFEFLYKQIEEKIVPRLAK